MRPATARGSWSWTDTPRDETVEISRRAGAEVHRDPGAGKGAAIRASLELVAEPVVVFMDADGSHDPDDIPRLTEPVLDDSTDLCVGSRFTGGSEELSMTFGQLIRTIGNIAMNVAINERWKVRADRHPQRIPSSPA